MRILRRCCLPLLFAILFHLQAFSQGGQVQLDAVAKTFEAISRSHAYTEDLTSAAQNVLPIGIKRVHNNMEVTIAVDKAIFHKDYTELSVFAKAILPQKTQGGKETILFFGARGIKLSHDGSIIGDASLVLLEDIEIPFNNGNMSLTLLGDYNAKTGQSDSGTYMSIDCFGFKELSLDVELRFPDTMLQKVADDGAVNPSDKVVAGRFRTVVQDWNDILVEIDLPRFQIVGLEGFVFGVQDVVFDFSDAKNGDALLFPAGYEQKYTIPGAVTLWRGVYARNLEITLPKAFNDTNSKPVRLSANNLLIDDNGVTGLFTAENILPFDSGNASGWNFSVDTFKVELEASKLVAAGFEGEIGLPVAEGSTRLKYGALIRENNEYLMTVSPVDNLEFSIFSAKATILPNSWMRMHVVDGRFKPEAMLHGHMTIATGGDVNTDIPKLEFRSLHIKTEAPYISIESLGYTGKVSIGSSAFGVSLDNIVLKTTGEGKVELGAGVEVALADGMFAGSTRIALLASMQDDGGRHKWRFDGVRLDEIGIKASIAETVKLEGKIGWKRNDPIYGEGFYGELGVEVIPVGVALKMRGAFGAVDGYKYWFVDGSAKWPAPGIPVMGPLHISGFAGAVSQRMRGQGTSASSSGSQFASATYVPDKSMGLGLKAAVMLGIGKVGNGEACFEISFSNSGGLSFIGFYGYASFASELPGVGGLEGLAANQSKILQNEQQASESKAEMDAMKQHDPVKVAEKILPRPSMSVSVSGTIGIQYDFKNKSFHAQTELFMNAGNILTGAGQNDKAGWGVIHISPEEWYMHLGSPDDRIGLKLNLANIINIQVGAYLMAGSRIPAMPPPPREVADILGMDISQLSIGRSIDALSTGKGFAFGADLRVATGDITFLILYANFAAGMGFDIMLKDYGDMVCAETGNRIGMDGWYAMGQAYAYLQGELGVKIDLKFIKAKFPIIKGGAAALLQAGLPSPSYFRGYMGVKFSILGGLVKGNLRFKLSLGDECTPVMPGGSPLQMPMISDLAPSNGESDISVFANPQATFTTAVGKQFDADDGNGVGTFRIALKSFTVTTEDGDVVNGKLKWNEDKSAVSFESKEVLPPNQLLKARVEVSFDRFDGGRWATVFTAGQEAIESKECTFTTGNAPDYIPLENVEYCYPVVDQQYFLTKESSKGFVQLQKGQKYLFERGFGYKFAFTGDDNRNVSTNLTYNEPNNRVEFAIPQLANQRKYALQLVYTPESMTATTGEAEMKQLITDGNDGSVTVENRSASAEINADITTSILDYGFATSSFGTFRQKLESIDTTGNGIAEDAGYSFRFLYDVRAEEAFDEAEIVGVTHSGGNALIVPTAELKEPFYTETVNPLVYDGYPFGNIRINNRDEQGIGVPPIGSVYVYRPYLDLIAEGGRPTNFIFPFSYETGVVVEYDFRNLQLQVANNRQNVSPEIYNRFLTNRLPFIKKGKYKTVIRYVLPDGTVTSSQVFYFNNFLKFNE